ncbi:hypothetical protein [Dokdonella sp.]|uniref:hypothetical protein n=1 Tax=Dokdonella sp. TaxID=2291710 RepID=UPI001B1C5520|nr:hypothetical protein [Dokdonella sp.]MBO9662619.1 hypothetical protein [Dokdonella sp.]
MQRAYWSADFGEAHVVEAMLRAHGLHASVFDAGIVRQDWFKTLALGGYRVMVPAAQMASAQELLADYRSGAMTLADADLDVPACPRCSGHAVADDPRPRRVVFGTLLASQVAPFAFTSSPALLWIAGLLPFLPLAAAPLLGSRHRCRSCGAAFATPRRHFDALAHAVAEAEPTASAEPAG